MEKLVDARTVAEHLGVSPQLIYHLAGRGEIPSYHIGRLVRFKLTDVERWLEG